MHPDLHVVGVECASCGSSYTLRSTASSLAVDICANCHPAYTGVERATAGGSRVDRFNRRRGLVHA